MAGFVGLVHHRRDATQFRDGTSGSQLADEVALARPAGHDRIGAFIERSLDEIFELPSLVPPKGKPCQVISLDPKVNAEGFTRSF